MLGFKMFVAKILKKYNHFAILHMYEACIKKHNIHIRG